ncbi:Bodo-specific multi-copy gene family, putative, partial [Bodo saltans]
MQSLAFLLKTCTKPPPPTEVDGIAYLARHVNNLLSPTMELQERHCNLSALETALSVQNQRVETRNVAYCTSPRGTGKTQFVEWFVFLKRLDAMKFGRVIVRCCDKTSSDKHSRNQPTWISQTMEDRAQPQKTQAPKSDTNSTAAGLCELIRMHVEAVTGH